MEFTNYNRNKTQNKEIPLTPDPWAPLVIETKQRGGDPARRARHGARSPAQGGGEARGGRTDGGLRGVAQQQRRVGPARAALGSGVASARRCPSGGTGQRRRRRGSCRRQRGQAAAERHGASISGLGRRRCARKRGGRWCRGGSRRTAATAQFGRRRRGRNRAWKLGERGKVRGA